MKAVWYARFQQPIWSEGFMVLRVEWKSEVMMDGECRLLFNRRISCTRYKLGRVVGFSTKQMIGTRIDNRQCKRAGDEGDGTYVQQRLLHLLQLLRRYRCIKCGSVICCFFCCVA